MHKRACGDLPRPLFDLKIWGVMHLHMPKAGVWTTCAEAMQLRPGTRIKDDKKGCMHAFLPPIHSASAAALQHSRHSKTYPLTGRGTHPPFVPCTLRFLPRT